MAKVMIFVAENFRDEEFFYPYYRLLEAGHDVIVGGIANETLCKGKFGLPVKIDAQVKDCNVQEYDGCVIPGGWAPDRLRQFAEVNEFVRDLHEMGAVVASICHAGSVLVSAGILQGRKATSYVAIKDDMIAAGADWQDEQVVIDRNLITSRTPSDLPFFCKAIVEALKEK